jgi:hypothetical protein
VANSALKRTKDVLNNYEYHLSEPGVYLNRREFPVDAPVWFNPDDVAKGIDPVLTKAIDWISALSYSHDAALSKNTLRNASDSILVTTMVTNPEHHALVVSAIIKDGRSSVVNSLILTPLTGDYIWGAYIKAPMAKGNYSISIRSDDQTVGSFRRLPDVALFTSILTDVITPKINETIHIYPNPANGFVDVEINGVPGKIKIEITSVEGKIISTQLYPALYFLMVVPQPIRDAVYDLIARHRHKIM